VGWIVVLGDRATVVVEVADGATLVASLGDGSVGAPLGSVSVGMVPGSGVAVTPASDADGCVVAPGTTGVVGNPDCPEAISGVDVNVARSPSGPLHAKTLAIRSVPASNPIHLYVRPIIAAMLHDSSWQGQEVAFDRMSQPTAPFIGAVVTHCHDRIRGEHRRWDH
jgi:hypothetical protein